MRRFMFFPALIVLICFPISLKAIDLEYIRQHYGLAVTDKNTCRLLIDQLSQDETAGVRLAYLGAFQTIWAKHTLFPFQKLKTFNKGRKNIDLAVEQLPDNLEVRFVRLSVQKNCPEFLGYDKHIELDRAFLISNQSSVFSPVLSQMIKNLLAS